MAFMRGKTWVGLGVGAAALAALQQCDASLLKKFCDRDRCHTPDCRIERREPTCECRFGHHQTSWSPWASNCPEGNYASTQYGAPGYSNSMGQPAGCGNEPPVNYSPQPYVPEPTVPTYQQPAPGYESFPTDQPLEPILTAPPQAPLPSQFSNPPIGLPSSNPQLPPQTGSQFPVNQPEQQVPQFPQPELPLPPDVVSPIQPGFSLPMPQAAPYQPPQLRPAPPAAPTPNPMPIQPMPDLTPGTLPQVVPGSVGDPANGFVPNAPTRSSIPDASAYYRRATPMPVQPTTHWQQRMAPAAQQQMQQAPYSVPQPAQQGRWRVMPGYQSSQQPATSQPFTVPGGYVR